MPTKSSNLLLGNTKNRLNQIKEAFEENYELIDLVFERMPIGICITDESGLFVNVNEAYTEIYGYTKDELIGKPFTTVVPEKYREELIDLHQKFMHQEKEITGEWHVQDKHGEIFKILTNAAFIHKEGSNHSFKMTFVVRLDSEDEAHEQLEDTVNVLKHKIEAQESAMSLTEHDIRKNISTMVTVADIMMKMDRSEKDKKWLKMIKSSGYDTLDLLQATEDYISMEKGIYKKDLEVFDAIEVVKNIKKDYKDLIESKQTRFVIEHKDTDHKSLMIEADAFYFKRMLTNLITNALEASPDNTTVKVSFSTKDSLSVFISNQGVIPEDIRSNFFEKYITSGKSTGTGLGTYIAKLIAEVHQGTISFKTSEKYGTVLMMEFPKTMISSKNKKS